MVDIKEPKAQLLVAVVYRENVICLSMHRIFYTWYTYTWSLINFMNVHYSTATCDIFYLLLMIIKTETNSTNICLYSLRNIRIH